MAICLAQETTTRVSPMPIIKHLQDQDNLLEGRDAGLVPGQEGIASSIADQIYQDALERDIGALFFVVSPKRRAMETAFLVERDLVQRAKRPKIILTVENNLREIDQGKFVLPKGYKPGDHFEGLKIAGEIFSKETFNRESPDMDNLLYRYGDPVQNSSGKYEYPELAPFFTETGESYRDVLIRFYSCAIRMPEWSRPKGNQVYPVVFTHGQPHQIFNDLSIVADKVCTEGLEFSTGMLPRICWDVYQSRRKGVVSFGKVDFVKVESLFDPRFRTLLEREIAHLESLR